ncbi:DUF3951 domain-containing protein [Paenibacillus sp. IHBB 10380]|uniref:DUF3951 domain-containing protein n=1 Tax=Paenibacillus sp. IHBB 10380 TaxID=1566358 RepID=UPI0005D8C33F|nr:DUF3951 domain-containing protein [Paenibacillus sp. IHBB 10380]AJS58809.1 hypothetical protein UB51_10355 [Paenibacillus sp. IHBB 10380]
MSLNYRLSNTNKALIHNQRLLKIEFYADRKIITKKELPSSNYTPFDYITSQTNIEFHEEKEETEEENDKGDDKDKNNNK